MSGYCGVFPRNEVGPKAAVLSVCPGTPNRYLVRSLHLKKQVRRAKQACVPWATVPATRDCQLHWLSQNAHFHRGLCYKAFSQTKVLLLLLERGSTWFCFTTNLVTNPDTTVVVSRLIPTCLRTGGEPFNIQPLPSI